MKDIYKKLIAECIGTCVLVLVACGIAVISNLGGDAWWIATSLGFGLVIVVMDAAIGHISGCHINPAVSLACAIKGDLSWKDFGLYSAAQVVGGFVGSLLLAFCLRGFDALGSNSIQIILFNHDSLELDAFSYIAAFVIEVILTFIFVYTILCATDKEHHDYKHPGIIIGVTLTLVHMFGLGFTGTSVNPARSLAPAVLEAFAGNTDSISQIWIWLLAPMAGATAAAYLFKFLNSKAEKSVE